MLGKREHAFPTAFLIRPGDRQGPGHIEMTLATLYDVFSHPGDLLHLPKAAVMLKVKAKVKKSRSKISYAWNCVKRKNFE